MPEIALDITRDIINLSKLAQDVVGLDRAADALTPVQYAQPHHRLPDYARHQEGISQLGALASEAVVHQFEIAAKSIEAMGQEMVKVVERCDGVRAHALATMKKIEQTALRYREEARKEFDKIQHNALLVEHVADTCDELQRKIAATAEAT